MNFKQQSYYLYAIHKIMLICQNVEILEAKGLQAGNPRFEDLL